MTDINEFVNSRLEGYRDRTLMFGGLEAVELQALLLLEMELFYKKPDVYNAKDRAVMNAYLKALNESKYLSSIPLSQQVAKDLDTPPFDIERIRKEFGEVLFDLCTRVRERLGLL